MTAGKGSFRIYMDPGCPSFFVLSSSFLRITKKKNYVQVLYHVLFLGDSHARTLVQDSYSSSHFGHLLEVFCHAKFQKPCKSCFSFMRILECGPSKRRCAWNEVPCLPSIVRKSPEPWGGWFSLTLLKPNSKKSRVALAISGLELFLSETYPQDRNSKTLRTMYLDPPSM